MEVLVVQEAVVGKTVINKYGKEENSVLNILQAKTEKTTIAGFPVKGKQITFYFWTFLAMLEGSEILFKVNSYKEDGKIADVILQGPEGSIIADVKYEPATLEDGTEIVCKHLSNLRLVDEPKKAK